jgi:Flp pilus assembly pilin Flp
MLAYCITLLVNRAARLHNRLREVIALMLRHLALHTALLRFWRNTRGQDMIEYALIASFITVAAAAVTPSVAASISTIFSQVGSVITLAAS